jgi:hypothetical protein
MAGDVNTYLHCEQLSLSHVISDQIIGWTGRWSIMGSFVLCTQCLAMQQASEANAPFVHLQNCIAEHHRRFPWHELATVLGKLPLAKPHYH